MILDTNALSALSARNQILLDKLALVPRIAVTLISLGEFHFGILGSSSKLELTKWLKAFLQHADVYSPSQVTLTHYASIRMELKKAGTPIPSNDVWIAALTRQYNLPLVSRDTHFDKVFGLTRVSW